METKLEMDTDGGLFGDTKWCICESYLKLKIHTQVSVCTVMRFQRSSTEYRVQSAKVFQPKAIRVMWNRVSTIHAFTNL